MQVQSGESLLEVDDLELLARAKRGEVQAFNALVDRHGSSLLRLAQGLLGNQQDAEDVVQETFLGAFRGVENFAGRAAVRTWLGQILVRQAALWRRKHTKHRGLKLSTGASEQDTGVIPVVHKTGEEIVDARLDVQDILQRLSPEHREVLILREMEQMSYDNIAQTLGIPRGTVESRLNRARNEVRAWMQGERHFAGEVNHE